MSTGEEFRREIARLSADAIRRLTKAEALLNNPGRFDADRKMKAAWEVQCCNHDLIRINEMVEEHINESQEDQLPEPDDCSNQA